MNKRLGISFIGFTILVIIYFLVQVFNGVSNPAEQTYIQQCADCHGMKGEGLGILIPPLAQSDWLRDNQMDLACIIKYGMDEDIIVNGESYTADMIGLEDLSSIQLTNIINYINSSWGNEYGFHTVEEIERQLEECLVE